ncbi:MAG: hypothetical protein ABGZ53_08915, partial [Fuerstiella sp.]
ARKRRDLSDFPLLSAAADERRRRGISDPRPQYKPSPGEARLQKFQHLAELMTAAGDVPQ